MPTATLKTSGIIGEGAPAPISGSTASVSLTAGNKVYIGVFTLKNDSSSAVFWNVSRAGWTFTRYADSVNALNPSTTAGTAWFEATVPSTGSGTFTISSNGVNALAVHAYVYEVTNAGSVVGEEDERLGDGTTDTIDGAMAGNWDTNPASSSLLLGICGVDSTDSGTGRGITEGTGWTKDAQLLSTGGNLGSSAVQRRTGTTDIIVRIEDVKAGSGYTAWSASLSAIEITHDAGGGSPGATDCDPIEAEIYDDIARAYDDLDFCETGVVATLLGYWGIRNSIVAPPAGLSIAQWAEVSNWFAPGGNGSTKSITGLSWNSGDTIIFMGGGETGAFTFGVTPSNANLSFGSILLNVPASPTGPECFGVLYKATAASSQTGQTITVTHNATASAAFGGCVWVIPGASGTANVSGNTTESPLSLTVSGGSVVCYILLDWNATNPPGKTPLAGSGTSTERRDQGDGSRYAQLVFDWAGVSAGTYNFGPNNYTSLTAVQLAIEVLD
jgi:hypothetical protein